MMIEDPKRPDPKPGPPRKPSVEELLQAVIDQNKQIIFQLGRLADGLTPPAKQ